MLWIVLGIIPASAYPAGAVLFSCIAIPLAFGFAAMVLWPRKTA